jgi:hypothetical protein
MLEDSNINLVKMLLGAVAALPLSFKIVSSLLTANRFLSRINRQAVTAQMNNSLINWTKLLIVFSPGQLKSK